MYYKRKGGGGGNRKFVYPKWPKSTFPFLNFIFPNSELWKLIVWSRIARTRWKSRRSQEDPSCFQ